MWKRICATLALFAGAAAAFGHGGGLSVGAGGILGKSFTNYTLHADGPIARVSANQNVRQFDYGFFVFLDVTYATFAVFLQNGAYNFDEPVQVVGIPLDMSRSGLGWETALGFSALGRFPIRLNDRLSVFPLLGMDYQIALSRRRTNVLGRVYHRNDGVWEVDKDDNAFRLSDWNAFHVRVGAGAEFSLGERLFLRGDVLYGIRLMTGHERKNLTLMKKMSGDNSPTLGGLNSGPSVRLGAGLRLFVRE